jgi:hypothetical protein
MRLLVLNGSPRGTRSNTDVVLTPFLAGFAQTPGNTHETLHLVRASERAHHVNAFAAAETVLVAFPLYVDAMPAPVKELVEALSPLCGRAANPRMLFLVQSGFPEACHSRPVERWAEKLARRLGSPYVGTIVKGGVEGIQAQPPWMTRRLRHRMLALGRAFGETGLLDPGMLAELARPERLGRAWRVACHVAAWSGVFDLWWNSQLRAHGALAERDAQPYAPAPRAD